jgi:hypothetical protein
MLLHGKSALLLVLWMCAGSALPALAQQSPPATPLQSPLASPPPCEAFRKNADDDWVARQDLTVPGLSGPVQIKAGTIVNDDLQDELDDRCK